MQLTPTQTALAALLALVFLFPSPASAQMRQVYLDTDSANHILKISFYSPAEGWVAFSRWLGFTTDSGRTFEKRYVINVDKGPYSDLGFTDPFRINGVKAFDKNTFILYGDYGRAPAILRSTNGGTSFRLVYYAAFDPAKPTTGVLDIDIPQGGDVGYAVDGNRILKTTNKGVNWSVSYRGARPGRINAINANNVFVGNIADGSLLKTTNGGVSWTTQTLPALPTSMYFTDATNGWLSTQGGVYRTSDGAAHWRLVNDSVEFTKMYFVDAATGYALSRSYTVYKTTDSGVVWIRLQRDNHYADSGYSHNDLFCLSSTQVWAGGGHGFLEMSTNGGIAPPVIPPPVTPPVTPPPSNAPSSITHQYPNPVTSTLIIENLNPSDPFDAIVIYNSTGNKALTLTSVPATDKLSVSVGTLNKGFYTVVVRSRSGKESRSVFVKL
ncbi:MAG: T9SS type A sorting domain-containing protein [Bacteroidetes bacterium]|nr:T9SS type A sorting domain-containing protein [Bacteroidota bacterium]